MSLGHGKTVLPREEKRIWGFINTGTLAHPGGRRLGMLVSCPAYWRRQLMDLVTDSSEDMNEAIVHLA